MKFDFEKKKILAVEGHHELFISTAHCTKPPPTPIIYSPLPPSPKALFRGRGRIVNRDKLTEIMNIQ